jgi:hypothetical protein
MEAVEPPVRREVAGQRAQVAGLVDAFGETADLRRDDGAAHEIGMSREERLDLSRAFRRLQNISVLLCAAAKVFICLYNML